MGFTKSLTSLQQNTSEQNTAGCSLCRTVLGQLSLQQGQLRKVVHHTHASGAQAGDGHQSVGKVTAGHELHAAFRQVFGDKLQKHSKASFILLNHPVKLLKQNKKRRKRTDIFTGTTHCMCITYWTEGGHRTA